MPLAGSSITTMPGAADRSSRHSSGESGSRVCTFTDSEWPVYTGTRVHVADTPMSGRPTTAPASANRRAHSPLVDAPAENSAMSKPWIVSSERALQESTWSPQSICRPTERSDANATTSSAGNARSRITPSMVEPTAPVAPTTATRTSGHHRPISHRRVLALHAVLSETERGVEPPNRGRHVRLANHARDLDRGGGDHLDVDAGVAEHRERLGRDAGMALHSR